MNRLGPAFALAAGWTCFTGAVHDAAGMHSAAGFSAAAAASVAGSHPWHDSMTEVRPRPAAGRLEVSLRIDAAHLEQAVRRMSGQPIDLERISVGSAADGCVAEYLMRHVRGRLRLAGGGHAPMQFHWVGRELDGSDCRAYIELIAPPISAADPAAGDAASLRFPVELRVDPLLPELSRHVITVSVIGGGSPVFSADRRGWQSAGVRLGLRPVEPLVTHPAAGHMEPLGRDETIVYLLPDPGRPTEHIRKISDRIAVASGVSRVIVLGWPGLDGAATPPDDVSWPTWVADALARTVTTWPSRDAVDAADMTGTRVAQTVRLLVVESNASRLVSRDRWPPGIDAAVVLPPSALAPPLTAAPARGGWTLTERAARYRRELSAAAPASGPVVWSPVERTPERRQRIQPVIDSILRVRPADAATPGGRPEQGGDALSASGSKDQADAPTRR